MRIINARVFPVDRPVIENGYVDIEAGRIRAVGAMPPPGEAEEILDAGGGWLFPGFVDAHTHIGMWEDGLGFEGDDGNEDTDPATPQLRAVDAINMQDRCFAEAAAAGVTTVLTGPGSANPIGGQFCAVKTYGARVDDAVVMAPVAMKMALGENPKTVYHGINQAPVTRMATAAIIREELYKAKEYFSRKARAEDDPEQDEPDFDIKMEALQPLLWGKAEAHFHAHRADDIFTALRIAKEFGLRAVIIHGTEAHLVADLLAEEHVPVVSGPYMTDRSKPEIRNLSDAAPGLLCKAGIETAITVDHPEIPLRLLPMALMLAVRAGMDKTDALRAVTSVPAKIAGMQDRIGSLKTGLDADCVLWSGDPLDIATQVQAVFVNGTPEYRRTK